MDFKKLHISNSIKSILTSNIRRVLFVIFMSILGVYPGVSYSGDSNQRIQGVADFLVDRANENFLYIFESKAKRNVLLSCYFQNTHSLIRQGDLRLLMSSSEIWEDNIEKDIKILVVRATANQIVKTVDLNGLMIDGIGEYIEIMNYLLLKHEGQEYSMTYIPLNSSQELRNKINLFYSDFNDFINNVKNINEKLNSVSKSLDKQLYSVSNGELCLESNDSNDLDIKSFEGIVNDLKTAQDKLKLAISKFDENKIFLTLNKKKIKADCKNDTENRICKINNGIEELIPVIKDKLDNNIGKALLVAALLPKYVDNIKNKETATAKVVEAFSVISESAIQKDEKLMKLRKTMLFFAQLSDVEDSSEVSQILSSHVLPITSFLVKREEKQNHFMITAYLGYSTSFSPSDELKASDNLSGIFAPIGIEYSKGYGEWNYNIMLAPFDFGYPVSLKLNGSEEKVEFDEIFAPSVSISFGFNDLPIVYGISHQKGRSIGSNNETEDRNMIFISFDMPLFSFN